MRLYNLSREFHILPFSGALMDQPDDVIRKFEVIMLIRSEEADRAVNKPEPPPKE